MILLIKDSLADFANLYWRVTIDEEFRRIRIFELRSCAMSMGGNASI